MKHHPFFYEIDPIHDAKQFFNEFIQQNKQKIFFSYFKVTQKYYLFFYTEKLTPMKILNFLYHSLTIRRELDSKERQIRSFRGFFLFALEIMGQEAEILETNLSPFFWRQVGIIIRQNKKDYLKKFLFGTSDLLLEEYKKDYKEDCSYLQDKIEEYKKDYEEDCSHLQNKIEDIQEMINSLQKKVIELETQDLSSKKQLRIPPESPINRRDEDEDDYMTLSQLSEDEKIEIIKLSLQLQAEKKISLKKYFQSRDSYSLYQLKGYRLKSESIRKNKLYKKLKEEFYTKSDDEALTFDF